MIQPQLNKEPGSTPDSLGVAAVAGRDGEVNDQPCWLGAQSALVGLVSAADHVEQDLAWRDGARAERAPRS